MELNEYEKIVILSTLAEPRTLHDISKAWYGHKTRLYNETVRDKLNEAVKRGTLIKEGKNVYRANTPIVLTRIIDEIGLGEERRLVKEYRDRLKYFYINLGSYTQKVYLSFDIIKALTRLPHKQKEKELDVHKGLDLDLRLLLQLPFLLRYVEKTNSAIANLFIQLLTLEDYEHIIESLEFQNRTILRENKWEEDWIDCFHSMDALLPKLDKKGIVILTKSMEAMKKLGGH